MYHRVLAQPLAASHTQGAVRLAAALNQVLVRRNWMANAISALLSRNFPSHVQRHAHRISVPVRKSVVGGPASLHDIIGNIRCPSAINDNVFPTALLETLEEPARLTVRETV